MDPTPSSSLQLGVSELDLTPATGPLWGRLRGLVVVASQGPRTLVICAADGVRIGPDTPRALASAVGLPAAAVHCWPGGHPVIELPVDAVAAAVRAAWADRTDGSLRLGRSVAWGLRTAPTDSPLLAGQRLRRSHRQLGGRAVDPPLEALVERLHHAPPPPGVPWGALLVDLRLTTLAVHDAAGALRAVVGWVAGADPFEAGGWPTAGLRGEAARRLSERLTERDASPVPVVVVGPSGPGMLGDGSVRVRGAESARGLSEASADALSRQLARSVSASVAVPVETLGGACLQASLAGAPVRGGEATLPTEPTVPADPTVGLQLLRLGDAAFVSVPGRLSDGLRLRIEDALATPHVFPLGPSGGEVGDFTTSREAHQLPTTSPFGPEQGRWLDERCAELEGALSWPEGEVAGTHPPAVRPGAPDTPDLAPAPHVVLSFRRGRAREGAARTLDLHARWRLPTREAVAPPGLGWQVRLEWERKGAWVPAHARGVPVDDRHQGMRLRFVDDGSGPQVHLRWSVIEPRRWTGRRVRLRVGPAYGGPLVSAATRLK